VILSDRLARHLQYAVGDAVQVTTGNGSVQEFEVVAIDDAYGYFPHPDERLYGVVSDRWMKQDFCLDVESVGQIAVKMDAGGDAGLAVVKRALEELAPGLAGVNYETGAALKDYAVRDIGKDFFLFDFILGLTALLAGLGILNGQLLAALERSKELGVLRALGASRTQLAGAVLLESALVGLLGALLGLVLGAGLTPVIVRALEALSGLPLPLRSAGAWLGACVAGALLLTLLAGIYPTWRMNRLDPVRAVRTG
jgi:putative ABC transport system permease protein